MPNVTAFAHAFQPPPASAYTMQAVQRAPSVLVDGRDLFTILGGPVILWHLALVCVTANDTTASTVQFRLTPTTGAAAQTISAASGALTSAAPGASVVLAGTALTTAAVLNANGPNVIANPGTIFCPPGVLDVVVGVGSTTGTWAAYLSYLPLDPAALVLAA